MEGFNIKLDLSKLAKTGVKEIQGRKYVVMSVEDNNLFVSDRTGSIYMNLNAIALKSPSQYGDTHLIKNSISKERFSIMSDEERKQTPIVGNMKPHVFGGDNNNSPREEKVYNKPVDDSALPF